MTKFVGLDQCETLRLSSTSNKCVYMHQQREGYLNARDREYGSTGRFGWMDVGVRRRRIECVYPPVYPSIQPGGINIFCGRYNCLPCSLHLSHGTSPKLPLTSQRRQYLNCENCLHHTVYIHTLSHLFVGKVSDEHLKNNCCMTYDLDCSVVELKSIQYYRYSFSQWL